jgi:hypothetical protein
MPPHLVRLEDPLALRAPPNQFRCTLRRRRSAQIKGSGCKVGRQKTLCVSRSVDGQWILLQKETVRAYPCLVPYYPPELIR